MQRRQLTGERLVARMIQAGACGYLFKNCDKDELLAAIRSVYKNGFYFIYFFIIFSL